MHKLDKAYRFYGFGNYYLSSLQQGLQAAHAVGNLCVGFKTNTPQHAIAYEWALNHKTMVLLNGGNSDSLANIHIKLQYFAEKGMTLPFTDFHEDEASLNGALTYVGIIIPSVIYESAQQLRNSVDKVVFIDILKTEGFKDWEIELMQLMNQFSLAQ